MLPITIEQKLWADEVWTKVERKLERVAHAMPPDFFPYITEKGHYTNRSDNQLHDWWTNGFWVGMLWLLYQDTGKVFYKTTAETLEAALDPVIEDYYGLHHDVGFMWLLSSVANYRITGSEQSKRRGLHVAATLAGRFNVNGNFIRAWNNWEDNSNNTGWAIIDCMMNIPLLYWATKETNDPRFASIAQKHADTIMQYGIRSDGSVQHIIEFDPQTGAYIKNHTGQGYDEQGSWTRGQAWALYGFVLSYIHTQKQEYLDTAKRVAHYFIAALGSDYVPPCDFRSPATPEYKDTTAGVCAACGLLEIANAVPPLEKKLYTTAAMQILTATEQRYCDYSDTEDSIVQMGTVAYHFGEKNTPIIYGDYFFVEALSKLRGNTTLLW